MENSENIFVLFALIFGLVSLVLNGKYREEIKSLKKELMKRKYQKKDL